MRTTQGDIVLTIPTARAPDDAREAIRRLFRRRPVADLKVILAALRTKSPMTAFRRLSELGYLSSYSHTGRYYTLADIPQFDEDGLWLHDSVGFSRHGTLKATVPVLVGRAAAGLFHRDLQTKLQVRVHNTLLDLVQAKLLRREPIDDEFLYVSASRARAHAQLAERRALGAPAAAGPATSPPALVIEILLEVIHAAGIRGDPEAVAARLAGRGVAASVAQIEVVFREHGLPVKKTPPSLSPRSRR
jgi:hypothetical protein